MIADTAFIYICIIFVIGVVVPQLCLILWFDLSYIQAGKIRSRGRNILSFSILYDCHYTGKY